MKKKVLFLCTENSFRSQMAEGISRHLESNKYEVFSAGTKHSVLNPKAIKVMAEIGIDKVIKNTITNSTLRFLLLTGKDPKGHHSGKTLLALWK